MDTIILRFNLFAAFFAVAILIDDFSWSRLFACLGFAAVYGFVLLWLNEHNHSVLFYAVSLFGAAVMWYHVFAWINEPKPFDLRQHLERQHMEKQRHASQPKQLPR